jgi:hypothetical protein
LKERLKLDAISLIAIIIDSQSKLIGPVPTGIRLLCLPQNACPDVINLPGVLLS